jgi:translation initiation factor IF-2
LYALSENRQIILSENRSNGYPNSVSSVMLYSSKPFQEKKSLTKGESLSDSSPIEKFRDVPVEKEAISLFFEKRKAALAKEKQKEEEERGSRSDSQNRQSMRNQNQRRNERRHSSGFKQRHQQNRQLYERRKNTFHKKNNHEQSHNNYHNNKNHPEGLSDVLQSMSRHRNETKDRFHQKQSSQRFERGQYQKNNERNQRGSRLPRNDKKDNPRFDMNKRNDRNGINRSNKPEGTLRLAEMMKKLRKDTPRNLRQERFEQSSSARFSRDGKDASAQWRQKRFAIPSSERNEERRGQNRYGQPGRNPQPPQAEEFLQGRISRTDGGEANERNTGLSETAVPDRVVTLPINNSLSLTEVSSLFRVKVEDIKEKLMAMGVRDGDAIDIDILELLAMDFGVDTERSTNEPVVVDAEQLLMRQRRSDADIDAASDANLANSYSPRPPIVTIMGHVDHGKTTLMDALRRRSREQQKKDRKGKTSKSKKKKAKNSKSSGGGATRDVAGTEAGGITQIISAFQVALEGKDDKITFLDTPGHAAFRAMRQSGSHAADVIVLVVAADDGISEQTVEIIEFYKSIVKGSSDNGISMVVAVNKIDKPGIDAEEAQMRIENQLLEYGIISEGMSSEGSEYGQPVQVIPTSGITGEGLDDLMEGLLLQSEIMDLRADDTANGEGIIMDARQEKGLGVVADCIVRWGKIEKGDAIISGDQVSQIRMLKDVNNKIIKNGLPSQPVRIIGFKSLPKAGDPLMVVESEEIAEEILEQRQALAVSTSDRPDGPRSDVELHITGMRRGDTWRVKKFTNKAAIGESDGTVRIPIIVKADADGSLAAVRESLLNIGDESKHAVVIDPIMEGIGEVTPSDIQMAKESEATIFSFGSIRIDQSTMNLAESEGVGICSNNIIYSLLDEAKIVLGSYLPSIPKEHTHGRAAVKAIFSIDTEDGEEKIAGLNVLEGSIYKSKAPLSGDDPSTTKDLDCHFRVYRDGKLISPEDESVTGSSLRRFKEMVEFVRLGEECGLGLLGFTDFEAGDEIECYSVEMKKAKL